MNTTNLNNQHLSDEQITQINNALKSLEQAFEPLKVNLTPEERHKYGRVNEQNKLFINKVNDFYQTSPQLKSPDVDWEEFGKDLKSRQFLEGVINRLESLSARASNAKILHDYDNYHEALQDYAYTSFRANSKAVGYEQKHKELKQFFGKAKRNKKENQSEEAPNQ